jgi:hypothetical protein
MNEHFFKTRQGFSNSSYTGINVSNLVILQINHERMKAKHNLKGKVIILDHWDIK